MKIRFLIIAFLAFAILPAYGTITLTPFDLNVSSDNFFEHTPSMDYLILKPGDSQQLVIELTNNDSKPHTINLQMSRDEIHHQDRSFVFEPNQLYVQPGDSVTSILTVGANDDADPGTTKLHTLIAQSTSFGTKSFAFFVEVSETITPPDPDPFRRGSPGSMFPSTTNFELSEKEVLEKIPSSIKMSVMTDEYFFQGTYGTEPFLHLIYSKQDVTHDTRELEFWDNGGLLITLNEKDEYHTYDDHLQFLNLNEQQIQVNGQDGILSSHRVTLFLDDMQLKIESITDQEQLLQIAESMVYSIDDEDSHEIICAPGPVLEDGTCQPPKPSDFRESETFNSSVIVLIQSIGAILIIGFIVFYAIKKRRKSLENEN